MSKKHKKKYKHLNYVEYLLVLASTFTGCVSISAFASLVAIPVGFTSSVVGIRICATTAGIKSIFQLYRKTRKNSVARKR